MKLIQELVEEVEYITEDYHGKRSHFITGPMIMGDQLNRNKRVYPFEKVLRPATDQFIREYVEQDRAVGDLGHSEQPGYTLKEVACKIVMLERDGKNYNGKMLITEGTPNGAIAKGLLEAGIKLGVSTKGGGDCKKGKFNGQEANIVESFRLTGIDIVHDPSAHIAMVNHIMENSEWVWDAATGWVNAQELVETVQKTVHKDVKQLNEENAIKWFRAFTRSLSYPGRPK